MSTLYALAGEANFGLNPDNEYPVTAHFPSSVDGRTFDIVLTPGGTITATPTGDDLTWTFPVPTSQVVRWKLVDTTDSPHVTLMGGTNDYRRPFGNVTDDLTVSVLTSADLTIEVTVLGGTTTSGGGSGAVSSVNGRTGDVVGLAEASALTSEAATRASADTALNTAITNEASTRATAITTEATTRSSADSALDSRLDALEADPTTATALAAEATARASADSTEATARANADTTEATARATADALLIPLTQKAAANGVATLGSDSKIPANQLPSIAISDFLGTVVSQAAMLALTGQRGDWAIRSDTGTTWMLVGDDATQLANWKQLATPVDAVSSVNGRTGAVTGLAEATDVTSEATTRASADTTLQSNITAEATARASADTTEATARAAADTTLQTNIDAKQTKLTPTTAKTSNYTAAANELVKCDSSGGAFQVTLPTAPADKSIVEVKQVAATSSTVTVACGGSDVFNRAGGAATATLVLVGQSMMVQYQATGALWIPLANDVPLPQLDLRFAPLSELDTTQSPNNRQTRVWDAAKAKFVLGAPMVSDRTFVGPLQRFHIACANAANAPVKVMFIGDSELAYVGCHTPAMRKLSALFGSTDRTLTDLASAQGTWAPGDPTYGVGGGFPVWTQTGGVTSAQWLPTRGLSGGAIQLTNGQTVTTGSLAADAVTFRWLAGAGGSTLDLQVDGVTVQTVTASAAGSYTANVSAVPAGHTYGFVSHGTTIVDHIQFLWGNINFGVQVYNAARSGSTATDANAWTDLAGYIASINPDLVVLEHQGNDFGADTTGATWYSATSTLINTIRANATSSICLWGMGETQGHSPWAVMPKLMRQLATEKNVAHADAADLFPSVAASDPFGLYLADRVHFSAKGCELFSNVLLGTIIGEYGRSVAPVDATGGLAAKAMLVRGRTKYNSGTNYPTWQILDTGNGGIEQQWYLSEGDTQPAISLGSWPNAFFGNFIRFGPGGTTLPDTIVSRTRSYFLSVINGSLVTIGTMPLNVLSISADVASTATTAEQDLYNASPLVVGLMAANGDMAKGSFFGSTGSNARTKQLKLYVGGTVVLDTGAMAYSGAATDCWEIEYEIVRYAVTAVKVLAKVYVRGTSTSLTAVTPAHTQVTGLSTLASNALAVRLTATVGVGAAASDVILKAGKLLLQPA